jgi:excisionase family DNA binding protein
MADRTPEEVALIDKIKRAREHVFTVGYPPPIMRAIDRRLGDYLSREDDLNYYGREVLDLPDAVLALPVAEMAGDLRNTPGPQLLSTQEAAEILQVSRPTVVKLLEDGKIPYTKYGTHRRVQLTDLLAYQEQARSARASALAELSYESARDGTDDESNHCFTTRGSATPDTGQRAVTLPVDAVEQIVNLACEFETNELSTYTLRVNAARLVDLWSAAPAPATERAGGYALGTPDAAREAGRAGWNIRCNRCGGYGARWMPGERPGWHFGNLALCDLHADELGAEYRRHWAALAVLREVRYEQEPEAL